MKTLSLAIIGKNEIDILERGLSSIYDAVDEIVYVDTGGTDGSVEVAKKYGAKIYNFEWIDHFGKARNFLNTKTNSDYTMLWDTDFILDKNSKQKLLKLKEKDFYNVDTVNIVWGLEYDEDKKSEAEPYGKLLKYIYRDLINKTGEYTFSNRRVHESCIFNKGNENRVSKNQDILVHHIQKLSNKILRKDQNISLALLDFRENPGDLELNIYLSETYFYIKDYESSLNYIEKYLSFEGLDYYKKLGALEVFLKCCIELDKINYAFTCLGKYYDIYKNEAKYVLLCADLLYFIDKKEALKMYIQYVKIRNKNGPHQSDIFRNTVHPEQMIRKISKEIAL